jgi:mRNA-degrading endonuclease RelE of RelBE toxin-antitoxin system
LRVKILASEQVQNWITSLPPDPRRRVRLALRSLAENRGDIKALEAELAGLCRLRVGGYRIAFSYEAGSIIRLEYADLRELGYERFLRLLKEGPEG